MKGVCAVGLSHRTARVDVRERFALDPDARMRVARSVRDLEGIAECVVLSTCNRTEIYAAAANGLDRDLPSERIVEILLAEGGNSGAAASDFFELHGEQAVAHALSVATGIDSMVLGETQILGQMKQAFQDAVAAGTVGPAFQKLFALAFRFAKRAHTETAISEGQASVGSIAVELAAKVFADLERRTVLLLGAGDTGETVAVAMAEKKIARMWIAGRGLERSSKLAERTGAVPLPLDQAIDRMSEADIVLTAASPPDGSFLLTKSRLERAAEEKRGEPLLVIDVGVPRNVDPAARDLADLFLYDLDDLESVAEETRRRRKQEVKKVEAILEYGVLQFAEWWTASQGVGPLLRELHANFDATRKRELERTLKQIPSEHHETIDRLTRSLVDKLLQSPTIELRRGGEQLKERMDVIRRLFGLSARTDGKDLVPEDDA